MSIIFGANSKFDNKFWTTYLNLKIVGTLSQARRGAFQLEMLVAIKMGKNSVEFFWVHELEFVKDLKFLYFYKLGCFSLLQPAREIGLEKL